MSVDQAATRPAPPMPVRERGYAVSNPGPFWAMLQLEKTPELRWPQALEVYEDMETQDAQVGAVLQSVVTPILRAGWRVDGKGCRPEVTAHVASDLGLPIVGEQTDIAAIRSRGRFSWTEHIQTAVPDHLQFGHAVFEQVYYPAVDDGLLHLRKLGYRPARTIYQWNVASDGGLISIQQYARGFFSPGLGMFTGGGPAGPTLPVGRLVVYVHKKRGGNWVGRSVLRPAYKHWRLKDRLLRIQAEAAERNGMGIPVYEAAGKGQDELDAGEEIAAGLRAGENAGAALPNGAALKLLGVSGTVPDLLGAIRYHDEQIARSMLANILNLGGARGTGSYALGNTFNDVLSLAIEAIAENIRDTASRHIIEDLVDLNYGPDEPAPRLVFDEIGSKNDAIVAALATLVDAGVLQPDEDLETFIRTTLGLPPRGGAALNPVPKTSIKEDLGGVTPADDNATQEAP
ncbi:hypothetical protein GCM10028801_41150 [Nocardioides maradonensis]